MVHTRVRRTKSKSLARWGWSIHIVLFQQDSADEPGYRFFVAEDPDHPCPELDLVSEALDGVVGMKLGAILGGKVIYARTSSSALSIRADSFGTEDCS